MKLLHNLYVPDKIKYEGSDEYLRCILFYFLPSSGNSDKKMT
jgi:hypothetical protein